MPEVIFAPADGHRLAIEAPLGGSLGDLCDVAHAPVAFSCRSATCGTCRVAVLEGADYLLPPDAEERELLASLTEPNLEATWRLACTARMREGGGRLVLQPLHEPVTHPLTPALSPEVGGKGDREPRTLLPPDLGGKVELGGARADDIPATEGDGAPGEAARG